MDAMGVFMSCDSAATAVLPRSTASASAARKRSFSAAVSARRRSFSARRSSLALRASSFSCIFENFFASFFCWRSRRRSSFSVGPMA